jgi:hypothetical protein
MLELLSRAVVATGERGRSVPRGSPRAGGQSDPTDRQALPASAFASVGGNVIHS